VKLVDVKTLMHHLRPALIALSVMLVATGATFAQTNPPAPAPLTPPPVATAPAAAAPSATTPPVPGANSFTEGEARSRIESNGYTGVSDLQKDSQGIWRGKAMKDGKSVSVSLDFQGHVTAE